MLEGKDRVSIQLDTKNPIDLRLLNKKQSIEKIILSCLKCNKISDVANKTNLHAATVRRYLKELKDILGVDDKLLIYLTTKGYF